MINQSSILLDEPRFQSNNNEEEAKILTSKIGDMKKSLISRRMQSNEQLGEEQVEDINEVFDQRQLKIINDLSNNNENQAEHKDQSKNSKSNSKQLSRKLTMMRKQSLISEKPKKIESVSSCPVIQPEDRFRIVWDLFTMLVIFIAILILPLDISFTIDTNFFDIFNYISIVIFTMDILINFNTAFQLKGANINDRKEIALNYLKGWFWIDLMSTFPFDLIIDVATRDALNVTTTDESTIDQTAQNSAQRDQLISTMRLLRILKFFRFIKVVRMLRVLKLKKIFSKFEDYIDLTHTMIQFFQVLKLTFIMLFVAHWLACIWHFIADQEQSSDSDSWIRAQSLEEADWYVKYIAAVYWATATMTTVGYGDIVPITSVEKIFGIIVMLLACCIFAYIMNSIGGIFVSMDQNEKNIRQKMGQANQFLKSNDIPKDLQARVRKYLEYKYEQESTQVDEKKALQVLSSSLRDEVLAAVNTGIIEKSKIFTNPKFEKDLLSQLPFLLEEQIYGPEECIFLEGEDKLELENGANINERCLYFLNQGEVMLCIQKTFTYLKKLQKGETFGELGFFSEKCRSASAYTLDFVYIQKLRRKDYLELLKSRRNQNEYFQMNRQMIELGNDFTSLGLKCFGCESTKHFAYNCPKLHYIVDFEQKQDMIKELCKKDQEFYKNFKRHEKVRYNARGCFGLTKDVAGEIHYVYQNSEDAEEDMLQRLQTRNEDEPNEEGNQINDKNEINSTQDEFDKVYIMTEFFTQSNIDKVIHEYNIKADERLAQLKQESSEYDRNKRHNKSYLRRHKKSYLRSNSAERAVYFERLIEKYGGPDQFMEMLNEAD